MANEYDDALQSLVDEYGVPDEIVSTLSASPLRKQLSEREKELNELRPAAAELAKLKKAPKRKEVFEELGVDFEALRPAELEALDGFDWDGDEPNVDQAAALLSRYQIPTMEPQQTGQEAPAAAQIAAQGARSVRSRAGTTLTPQQVADWAPEQIMRLRESNPDAFEQLKRGEAVSGVTPP